MASNMGKVPVVRCTQSGCPGECAVGITGGRTYSYGSAHTLVFCLVCWTPRPIGDGTARRMSRTILPLDVRRTLRDALKDADLKRQYTALFGDTP